MSKKKSEPAAAAMIAEPVKPPRSVVSKHDILTVGFRAGPAADSAVWMPELKLGNVKDPEKVAKATQEKTDKFLGECGQYPFTGQLLEVQLVHFNVQTKQSTVRNFKPTGSTSVASQTWQAIKELHPAMSWPSDRLSKFPDEGGLLIYGFDSRDFCRILAAEEITRQLAGGRDSEIPLRFWRDNELCFDPYGDCVSGDAHSVVSLSKLLSSAGLTWPGCVDHVAYVPHVRCDLDAALALDLAVRFNLLPKI